MTRDSQASRSLWRFFVLMLATTAMVAQPLIADEPTADAPAAAATTADATQAAPPAARPAPPPAPIEDEFTPDWERSIERGLRWLSENQNDDGSFGSSSSYNRHVGITALAGLAFLADGNFPTRGRYAKEVGRALDVVLNCSTESGLLIGPSVDHGPMYGHGFATLFLAEVYGETRDPKVREALRKAVNLMVVTQNDEGGWRYQARPVDADVSVTICSVMALRAARNSGIVVPKTTIDRAKKYVLDCQNDDGGFRYMTNSRGSAYPRSAAGLATLQYTGTYRGDEVNRAVAYLEKFNDSIERGERMSHYWYAHYYAVQALFLADRNDHPNAWSDYWPAIRDQLIGSQAGNGSWNGGVGREYSTAMALIILQVPKRTLPILQR